MRELSRKTAQTRASDPLPRAAPPKRDAPLPGTSSLTHDFGRIDVLSPQQQSQPAKSSTSAPSSAPLRYDDRMWTLKSPPAWLNEPDLEAKLGTLLTSFSVSGFKATDPPETRFFLLYDLRQVAAKENWGQEIDVIAPISRSTGSGPDPVGRVTIRIDEKGNGSIELIESGPVPAAPATKIPADIHFSKVRGEGGLAWSTAELNEVAAALSLIPSSDRKALDGAELVRVKTVPHGQAQFTMGSVTSDELALVPATLQVADAAFVDEPRFYGGTSGTVSRLVAVIGHEVGHAVANEEARVAWEARNAAYVDANKSYGTKKYKKAAQKVLKLDAAHQATLVDATFMTAVRDDAAAKKKTALALLSSATGSLRMMKAELVTITQPFIDQVEMTSDAIEKYETDAALKGADVLGLEKSVRERIRFRNDAKYEVFKARPANSLRDTYEKIADAQDEWFTAARAAIRIPMRSLRVQKFVELVEKEKIVPFTKYARDNWPFNPEEFYGDAYAMWLADPDFLSTNYSAIFDFFESGEYRK